MSRSLRFIAIALVGWVGIRAVSLGMVPGAEALAFDRSRGDPPSRLASSAGEAAIPPLVATEFAPVDPLVAPPPIDAPAMAYPSYAAPPQYGYAPPAPPAPVYYAAYPRQSRSALTGSSRPAPRLDLDGVGDWSLEPDAARYASSTPLDHWPVAQIARSQPVSASASAQSVPAVPPRLDRLSLTAWALLRSQPTGVVVRTEPGLAANGMLGGSQAGGAHPLPLRSPVRGEYPHHRAGRRRHAQRRTCRRSALATVRALARRDHRRTAPVVRAGRRALGFRSVRRGRSV